MTIFLKSKDDDKKLLTKIITPLQMLYSTRALRYLQKPKNMYTKKKPKIFKKLIKIDNEKVETI